MQRSRETLLERAAFDAARAWTRALRAQLAREGRRVEGGWPGTIREARTRGAAEAAKVLTGRSMSGLSHEELERVARITNDESRRSWRALSSAADRAAREDGDTGGPEDDASGEAAPEKKAWPGTPAGALLASEVRDAPGLSVDARARLTREIVDHEAAHGQCTKAFLKKLRKQLRAPG
jgi:hypothetical protein